VRSFTQVYSQIIAPQRREERGETLVASVPGAKGEVFHSPLAFAWSGGMNFPHGSD